ncbi:MAG: hypothetical protein ACI92Z_001794, partial [Paracoccaceae bacterium]
LFCRNAARAICLINRCKGAVLLVTVAFFLAARLLQNGADQAVVEMPLLVSSILVGIFLCASGM